MSESFEPPLVACHQNRRIGGFLPEATAITAGSIAAKRSCWNFAIMSPKRRGPWDDGITKSGIPERTGSKLGSSAFLLGWFAVWWSRGPPFAFNGEPTYSDGQMPSFRRR